MGSTEEVRDAVSALLRGELVVLPTDTVYGVAALASDDQAVARLLLAKGRPQGKPLPILVASVDVAAAVGDVMTLAHSLMTAFWPGPLTVIVDKREDFHSAALLGAETVGLRMPDNQLALAIIRRCGGVLAVSSANLSQGPDPLTVEDARAQLGDSVAVYVDGGPAPRTRGSTVVDARSKELEILREGPISPAALKAAIGAHA